MKLTVNTNHLALIDRVVEAGTLVDNHASQRVLEKNGFERFGLARKLLKINGEWRDHILFERIAD